MTEAERAKSKEICEAATPGPWIRFNGRDVVKEHNFKDHPRHIVSLVKGDGLFDRWEDAEFTSHARTALPEALEELDKQEQTHFAEKLALLSQIELLRLQVEQAKKVCPNGGNDGYITPRPCQVDTNIYALERAMYSSTLQYYDGDSCCYFCKYGPEGTDCVENDDEWTCSLCDGATVSERGGWQFDAERFSEW